MFIVVDFHQTWQVYTTQPLRASDSTLNLKVIVGNTDDVIQRASASGVATHGYPGIVKPSSSLSKTPKAWTIVVGRMCIRLLLVGISLFPNQNFNIICFVLMLTMKE